MRLTHFRVSGYKRLADVRTHVSGKMTVFIGPNEAGKSSVLEALAALSTEDSLAANQRTRGQDVRDDTVVVSADFELSDDDCELLSEFSLIQVPKKLTLNRQAGGGREILLDPIPTRDPGIRDRALARMLRLERFVFKQDEHASSAESATEGDVTTEPRNWLLLHGAVNTGISAAGEFVSITDDEWTDLVAVIDAAEQSGLAEVALARTEISAWHVESIGPSAADQCREKLDTQIPRFQLFDIANRDLLGEYDISDPDILINPPPALRNLFALADIDGRALGGELDDETAYHTRLNRGNAVLRAVFKRYWTQRALTVVLKIDGKRLLIMIDEHDTGALVAFRERSDGLKLFVALIAFLGSTPRVPTVLLVDEAETHLHYDAQADLIDTLMDQYVATQVLFTTHSPGCLPRDLGVGVRVVRPTTGGVSEIRHDFWAMKYPDIGPGFSPLLFSMGAAAAAFSSVRRAVVVEGPSDMILLPTLLRLATDLPDLPYQVVQGLSDAASEDFGSLEDIAPRVCYLTDGDAGGRKLRSRVLKRKVDQERVRALPTDCAVEDLIDVDHYLAVVNALFIRFGTVSQVTAADLTSRPIKSALKMWCDAHSLSMPSATYVAEMLIDPETTIRLTDEGAIALASLHAIFVEQMGTR